MTGKARLQAAIVLAGLVPVTAGALGVLMPDMLAVAARPSALTHTAYLSGLLLGIGLAFWSLVPGIERHGRAFGLLTAIVVLGGVARLMAAARLGAWEPSVLLPLAMELGVTPLLCLWQRSVAKISPSGLR